MKGLFSDIEIAAVTEYVRLMHRTGDRKLKFEANVNGFSVWYAEPILLSELHPIYSVIW